VRDRSFGVPISPPHCWVEAQDEGDPKNSSKIKDALFLLDAPFRNTATKLVELDTRFSGIDWGWDKTSYCLRTLVEHPPQRNISHKPIAVEHCTKGALG
jgi:hypothetical protein